MSHKGREIKESGRENPEYRPDTNYLSLKIDHLNIDALRALKKYLMNEMEYPEWVFGDIDRWVGYKESKLKK